MALWKRNKKNNTGKKDKIASREGRTKERKKAESRDQEIPPSPPPPPPIKGEEREPRSWSRFHFTLIVSLELYSASRKGILGKGERKREKTKYKKKPRM